MFCLRAVVLCGITGCVTHLYGWNNGRQSTVDGQRSTEGTSAEECDASKASYLFFSLAHYNSHYIR